MSCKSILPTNIDEKINALDVIGCEELEKIQEALRAIEDFHDALHIDERFLEILADSYEAKRFKDFEPRARELILYAQKHYPKLGTVAAVKEVLYAFGLDAEVKEWFETGKPPYIFDLDLSVSDRPISKELIEQIMRLVEFTKNVRSKLGELLLSYKVTYTATMRSGGVGEAKGSTLPKGYANAANAKNIARSGGVAEARASTKAVGLKSQNFFALPVFSGCAGESIATANFKEMG